MEFSTPSLWVRAFGLLTTAFTAVPAWSEPSPVHAYGQRMEALFVRMDVNGDGRLESGEVKGVTYLERRLERRDSRGFLLLDDLRPATPHPSGRRLQQRFRQADRNGVDLNVFVA